MFNWQEFEAVFQPKTDFSLDSKTVESILKHRKELGGLLFFDRIWSSIGLKQPTRNYPPKSNQELRSIWSKIAQCPAADEQKLALLYYILRDCRHGSGPEAHFARRTHLPLKYQLLVTGLWELDHCQFSRALEHLTDPSLTPTFADDILLTLLQHPKCDKTLAIGYFVAVSPPLKDQLALTTYFSLLAHISVVEAYHFAKRQGEVRHKALLEQLIVSVLQEPGSPTRAERSLQLVGLPLTPQEETWFEDCLLRGSASRLAGARDSVLVRRMARGQSTTDTSALQRLKGEAIAGVNWEAVKTAITDSVPS